MYFLHHNYRIKSRMLTTQLNKPWYATRILCCTFHLNTKYIFFCIGLFKYCPSRKSRGGFHKELRLVLSQVGTSSHTFFFIYPRTGPKLGLVLNSLWNRPHALVHNVMSWVCSVVQYNQDTQANKNSKEILNFDRKNFSLHSYELHKYQQVFWCNKVLILNLGINFCFHDLNLYFF